MLKTLNILLQNILKDSLLIFAYLTIAYSAQAREGDYESCNWMQESYTNNFIDEFKKEYELYPIHQYVTSDTHHKTISNACFFNSAKKVSDQGSQRRFIYCKQILKENNEIDWDQKYHTVSKECDENKDCKDRKIYPRRSCLNRTYIQSTSIAFHHMLDCFQLPPLEVFALFNHESNFISNIRSKTGARCYGQLTTGAINTINNQIAREDPIYTDFIRRCPYINIEKILIPHKKSFTSGLKFQEYLNCKTTQGPSACFFYSMFHIKKYFQKVEMIMDRTDADMKNFTWIEKELGITLPIKLNEVVTVYDNRKGKELKYLFKDEVELLNNKNSNLLTYIRENRGDKNIQIKKIHFFKEGKNNNLLKWLITYWSYNGGVNQVIKSFQSYITRLKNDIAIPCRKNLSKKRCKQRNAILSHFEDSRNSGLDINSDFVNEFSDYLHRTYAGDNSPKQVAYFVKKITRDLNKIMKDEKCEVPDVDLGKLLF